VTTAFTKSFHPLLISSCLRGQFSTRRTENTRDAQEETDKWVLCAFALTVTILTLNFCAPHMALMDLSPIDLQGNNSPLLSVVISSLRNNAPHLEYLSRTPSCSNCNSTHHSSLLLQVNPWLRTRQLGRTRWTPIANMNCQKRSNATRNIPTNSKNG
jgi:hypothetical protein